MHQLTFLSAEPPAKHSAWQGFAKVFPTNAEISHLNLFGWLKGYAPSGWFGKMCPASCRSTEEGLLVPSSEGWGQDVDLAAGGCMRPVTAKSLTSRGAGAGNLDPVTANMIVVPINTQLGLRGTTSNSSREGIGIGKYGDPAFTLQRNHSHAVASFKGGNGSGAGNIGYSEHVSPTLTSAEGGNQVPTLMQGAAVRRLTPRECERLQGFPDDYTLVKFGNRMMSDSQRYKMIGNSMAVPVMAKIGHRIEMIRNLMGEK